MKKMNQKSSCGSGFVVFATLIGSMNVQAAAPAPLTVQFNNETGHYTVLQSGAILVADAALEVSGGGAVLRTPELKVAGVETVKRAETFGQASVQRITFAPAASGLQLGLELATYSDQPWVTVHAWVKNGTTKAIALERFTLIRTEITNVHLGGPWKGWRMLTDNCGRVVNAGELSSENVSAMFDPGSSRSLVLGFSVLEAFGRVNIHSEGAQTFLSADANMDSVLVQPGETRWSERLHIGGVSPLEGVEQYAGATGREAGAKTDGPSWASWLSCYKHSSGQDRDVTEDVVLAFADGAEKFHSELPFQVALIDDGYQLLMGDWTTLRPQFPHGMGWLAERMKERNLVPGLWIALPLMNKDSKMFHPEWVDRQADGTPITDSKDWGSGETYSLDITRKDVQAYFRQLIRTMTHEWGYEYLKLDYNIAPSSNRADRSVTTLQALRNMYRLVREAAGPDVFIANCAGYPFPPAVGIAQAGRTSDDVGIPYASRTLDTSVDIAPPWQVIRDCSRQNILRSMFHRRWWVNDPDCMFFRDTQTGFNLDELRMLMTTGALCGGLAQFADPLFDDLPADRRRMVGQVLPSYGQTARPVDMMRSDYPQIFDLAIERPFGKWHVVGVYNWKDQPADIELDFAALGLDPARRYHVFDFWRDTYYGALQGSHVFKELAAHSCLALAVREEMPGQIELISTDLHITQGAVEVADISRLVTAPPGAKAELTLTLKPKSLRDGKLIFAAGNNLVLAACQGAKGTLVRRPDGLWEAKLKDMADQVALLLRWR
jgi:hypothetical protein